MNEEAKEPDLSAWFSTYGLLTAERILERFQIHLKHDELITEIKNPHSIYYQLLRIPIKNVFNGIILQQTHDYQVYAQKLFIDYLLSGQNDKEEGAPGADTREDLTAERTHMLELSEAFNQQEFAHQKLIAESQAKLISFARSLQKLLQTVTKEIGQLLSSHNFNKTDQLINKAIREAMIHGDNTAEFPPLFWTTMADVLDADLNDELRTQLTESLSKLVQYRHEIDSTLTSFLDQTNDVGSALRGCRRNFYQIILRVTELIKLLPDYQPNPEREEENRSSLHFDAKIGEES